MDLSSPDLTPPPVSVVDQVVVDEVHERSLDSDFLLIVQRWPLHDIAIANILWCMT